jgi:SAM-dependent methyltransferase
MSQNIVYRTDTIARHYGVNRRRWADLYPSERWVFERVAQERTRIGRVLDVGCAAGGLAEALTERYSTLERYTGVDINRDAIAAARAAVSRLPITGEFIAGDICNCPALADRRFDLVTALSVADWNIDTPGILAACWSHVEQGGHLVVSLRLTPDAGICDIERSFQYIWFEPSPPPPDAERAPYNVFNVRDAMVWLAGQAPRPGRIVVYGYWGTPSATARTPFARLVFAVIALSKPADNQSTGEPMMEVHLPADALGELSG